MPRPTLPDILKAADWQRHKGKIAKLAGRTGISEQMTVIWDALLASERDLPPLQTITKAPAQQDVDGVEEISVQCDELETLAKALQVTWKAHRLIPKGSAEHAGKVAAAASDYAKKNREWKKLVDQLVKDNKAFQQDSKKFIEQNRCTLALLPFAQITEAFTITKKEDKVFEYKDKDKSCNIIVREGPADGVKQLAPVLAGGAPRAFYLPYQEDACTYAKISSKALFCFTGELQGCNVYVATADRSEPIFLHTNANQDKDDMPKNIAVKDRLAAAAVAHNAGFTLKRRLARGYNIPAFVFGERKSTGWEFYLHALDMTRGYAVVEKARPLATV